MAFKKRDPYKLYPQDRLMKVILLPFIPPFVTPNMVTCLRFVLAPIVFVLLLYHNWAWGVPLFLFAALTDAVDGSLARVRHHITAWGSFYDPVADKLLIAPVVLFIVADYVSVWLAITILFFEVSIMAGGFLSRQRGHFVSANIFGKLKMAFQATGVFILLISIWTKQPGFVPASVAILIVSIALAAVSMFTYGL